jgi:hypothetical protein
MIWQPIPRCLGLLFIENHSVAGPSLMCAMSLGLCRLLDHEEDHRGRHERIDHGHGYPQ